MEYSVAVSAQGYALFDFFQSNGVPSPADQRINRMFVLVPNNVVKVNNGWMLGATLAAGQACLKF